MRESGGGKIETWVTLVPSVILLVTSIVLAGGPRELLDAISVEIGNLVTGIHGWFAGLR